MITTHILLKKLLNTFNNPTGKMIENEDITDISQTHWRHLSCKSAKVNCPLVEPGVFNSLNNNPLPSTRTSRELLPIPDLTELRDFPARATPCFERKAPF